MILLLCTALPKTAYLRVVRWVGNVALAGAVAREMEWS